MLVNLKDVLQQLRLHLANSHNYSLRELQELDEFVAMVEKSESIQAYLKNSGYSWEEYKAEFPGLVSSFKNYMTRQTEPKRQAVEVEPPKTTFVIDNSEISGDPQANIVIPKDITPIPPYKSSQYQYQPNSYSEDKAFFYGCGFVVLALFGLFVYAVLLSLQPPKKYVPPEKPQHKSSNYYWDSNSTRSPYR